MRGRLLLVAPSLIFGLAGVVLYWRFLQPGEGPFHENLLPELIGFCFEGFVLVGLLSLVQASRERQQRQQLWLSLRGSLRDVLSQLDLALLDPDAQPASTVELETSHTVIERLEDRFLRFELALPNLVELKQLATNRAPLARDLIGVAAQLSTEHMRSWIEITQNLSKLGDATSRDSVERAVAGLLATLSRFDRLAR